MQTVGAPAAALVNVLAGVIKDGIGYRRRVRHIRSQWYAQTRHFLSLIETIRHFALLGARSPSYEVYTKSLLLRLKTRSLVDYYNGIKKDPNWTKETFKQMTDDREASLKEFQKVVAADQLRALLEEASSVVDEWSYFLDDMPPWEKEDDEAATQRKKEHKQRYQQFVAQEKAAGRDHPSYEEVKKTPNLAAHNVEIALTYIGLSLEEIRKECAEFAALISRPVSRGWNLEDATVWKDNESPPFLYPVKRDTGAMEKSCSETKMGQTLEVLGSKDRKEPNMESLFADADCSTESIIEAAMNCSVKFLRDLDLHRVIGRKDEADLLCQLIELGCRNFKHENKSLTMSANSERAKKLIDQFSE